MEGHFSHIAGGLAGAVSGLLLWLMTAGISSNIHESLCFPLMVTKWLLPLLPSSPHKIKPKLGRQEKRSEGKISLLANLFFFFLRKEILYWKSFSKHPLPSCWLDLSYSSTLDQSQAKGKGSADTDVDHCDHSLGLAHCDPEWTWGFVSREKNGKEVNHLEEMVSGDPVWSPSVYPASSGMSQGSGNLCWMNEWTNEWIWPSTYRNAQYLVGAQ